MLKVAIVVPSLNPAGIGEIEWAFRWVEALSRRATLTVLTSSRDGQPLLQDALPQARVVSYPEIRFLYKRMERFNAMAKPGWPLFAHQVRRWLLRARASGDWFDIGHQILPQAMRHPTPFRGLGLPYVMGPVGGGLDTPWEFRREVAAGSSLASGLRGLDRLRLRFDPRLRATFSQADMVLGVAPYVRDRLGDLRIRRFVTIMERGHGEAMPTRSEGRKDGDQLVLAHVGRVVRTKGLRDTIRALAHLRDLPSIRLISAGDGPDLAACREEADRLGVADRVTFHGRLSRARVEELYAQSDIFCFPSFREPMGGVLFEAMAHGLPVITAARGGPDFIIDDNSGIRVPVTDPDRFPRDIAGAIRGLALDPERRQRLGRGARARLVSFGDWEDRADTVMTLYHEVLAARRG